MFSKKYFEIINNPTGKLIAFKDSKIFQFANSQQFISTIIC